MIWKEFLRIKIDQGQSIGYRQKTCTKSIISEQKHRLNIEWVYLSNDKAQTLKRTPCIINVKPRQAKRVKTHHISHPKRQPTFTIVKTLIIPKTINPGPNIAQKQNTKKVNFHKNQIAELRRSFDEVEVQVD